jgi:hypothetical protein
MAPDSGRNLRASRKQGATRGAPQSTGLSNFRLYSYPPSVKVVFQDHKFRLAAGVPSLAETQNRKDVLTMPGGMDTGLLFALQGEERVPIHDLLRHVRGGGILPPQTGRIVSCQHLLGTRENR